MHQVVVRVEEGSRLAGVGSEERGEGGVLRGASEGGAEGQSVAE